MNIKNDDRQEDNPHHSEKENVEEKIDEALEESFPASDPPSFSSQGNDDILPGREDIRHAEKSDP